MVNQRGHKGGEDSKIEAIETTRYTDCMVLLTKGEKIMQGMFYRKKQEEILERNGK